MNCKYLIGNNVTDCFCNQYDGVTIYHYDGRRPDHYDVKEDEKKCKYFEVNGEKILLTDLICDTPQEFVNNVKDRRANDLCNVLFKYGIDSITVLQKMKRSERSDFDVLSLSTISSDDCSWVEYQFVDEYLRSPEDHFRLMLVPKNDELRGVYPNWDPYVEDILAFFVNSPNWFKFKVSESFAER